MLERPAPAATVSASVPSSAAESGATPGAGLAAAAALHYVDDRAPGLTRRPLRSGFAYFTCAGARVRDAATLARIAALAIPPAWREVWICADPDGHLQATGFDARGRKQYRYHPGWEAVRDTDKYARMAAFGAALPRLRARIARDLCRHGMPREKVLAAVVRLLDATLVRVGNRRYARQNRTFGLTTLRRRHAQVRGARLRLRFTGKSGIEHDVSLADARVARIVRGCADLPGQHLFKYRDADGEVREVGSADVNAYLQEILGAEFTAKDFRTWAGSVHALAALRKAQAAGGNESESARKKAVAATIRAVAQRLRNTVAVCRKCYVHPAVLDAFMAERLAPCTACRTAVARLRMDEVRLLALLRAQDRAQDSPEP
ncbi:DNA topoisomerase IB [Cupriavidus sp. 30B13]|uniref:DNA topoisomerase IB n=1 Tax=Cupriavidus sp. 30B13 TaxID=3384241 RepID=UPI003B905F87